MIPNALTFLFVLRDSASKVMLQPLRHALMYADHEIAKALAEFLMAAIWLAIAILGRD
jgi:hypothetical protein